MCYLFIENKRELSYMWGERLLVSVGGLCVCDSHEGTGADPGFYEGGLTTPVFDQGWRVLSYLLRLTAGSRPEFAQ